MMQDFKTAHLLGVSPRAQFYAMLLGSGASVFVSVAAYELYTAAWAVPGPELPAPTAMIWLDMASLVCPAQDLPLFPWPLLCQCQPVQLRSCQLSSRPSLCCLVAVGQASIPACTGRIVLMPVTFAKTSQECLLLRR